MNRSDASARCLMFQGTASNVGKSLITAAVCRLYRMRGVDVAPFKSQNMSNHAFAAATGGEVSRAQAVQAVACGLEPHVDMSPILLKPQSDQTSQVIVLGHPDGELAALDYGQRRSRLADAATGALGRLRSQHDCVLIEGAGSPAEINLQASEIVNMFVARAADAPVILIGDIDRGGVFASLLGTLEWLPPDDRARVRGILVNKFRGDLALLEPGLAMFEQRTGVPILGVLPWRGDLWFPDEDSLALDERLVDGLDPDRRGGQGAALVDVIRYPRLANADDFNPLEADHRFSVRYVDAPADLRAGAATILPGSKSTVADLGWLRERGFDAVIAELAAQGQLVLGICGGYQMLGQQINDPDQVESVETRSQGLGLLPVDSHFLPGKQVNQLQFGPIAGSWIGDAPPAPGYEIHHARLSQSAGTAASPWLAVRPHQDSEMSCVAGSVYGTLVHGLFDTAAVRDNFCRLLGGSGVGDGLTLTLDQALDGWAVHLDKHVRFADLETLRWGGSLPLRYASD